MESVFEYSNVQYELVRESRQVLFNYCESMDQSDFVAENKSFGRGGSIRNLLVHIANTYELWIGMRALNKIVDFTSYPSLNTVNDTILLFNAVDKMMHAFIESRLKGEILQITYDINGQKNTVSAFKLFTHVITHEFHHKGQILSISRHLGYTPVDTDIMR